MTDSRISRAVVLLASLFFAGLALAIWVAPEETARHLGVEAVGAAGTAVLRADLGGLFGGMAVLCGAAAWTRRQPWSVAAGTMLTAIVVGRFLGWIDAGRVGPDVFEMAIELGILAALVVFPRSSHTAGASSAAWRIPGLDPHGVAVGRRRAWRRTMVAGTLLGVAGAATAASSSERQPSNPRMH